MQSLPSGCTDATRGDMLYGTFMKFCTVLWCITDRPSSSNHSNYRATVADMLHEPGRAWLTYDSVNTYISERETFEIDAAEENEMRLFLSNRLHLLIRIFC